MREIVQTREQLRNHLEGVFQNVFDDDSIVITEQTTAKDVDGWDSLMHITLVVTVEKEFGVRLSAAELASLKNVGEMLSLIEAKVSK